MVRHEPGGDQAVVPAGVLHPRAAGSLFSQYFTQAVAPTSRSFLKPAMAIAEETGLDPSKFQLHLWAHSAALFDKAMEKHNKLIRSVAVQADGEDPEIGNIELSLYVRSRKFDETTSILGCEWDHGPELLGGGETLVEAELGPTKVMASELQHGYCVKKTKGAETEHMIITGTLPSTLVAVERNSAECYLAALRTIVFHSLARCEGEVPPPGRCSVS